MIKWKNAFMAGVVLMLMGSGCGQASSQNAEELIVLAKETMGEIKSLSAQMTMKMSMGIAGGEVIESTSIAQIQSQSEPMRMKMDLTMQMEDGTVVEQMQMYAAEEDGKWKNYLRTGDTWVVETVGMEEIGQYAAEENVDLYLDSISDYRTKGQETVEGEKTTKIVGVITGDDMIEVMKISGMESSAKSLGISNDMLEGMYQELGDLPITLWIDAKGYVRKYEVLMTEVMQKIMDASMQAMGMAEEDIAIEIEKTSLSMVCGEFNQVGEIEIPSDAIEGIELFTE